MSKKQEELVRALNYLDELAGEQEDVADEVEKGIAYNLLMEFIYSKKHD